MTLVGLGICAREKQGMVYVGLRFSRVSKVGVGLHWVFKLVEMVERLLGSRF